MSSKPAACGLPYFFARSVARGSSAWQRKDGANNEVRTLARASGETLATVGRNGRQAGEFHWVHAISIDSKGNLYTGEVDTGKRIQKFVPVP